VSSNPNFESAAAHGPVPRRRHLGQLDRRTAFAVWTDYRNTVPGTDVREAADDDAAPGADVLQCRDVLPDGSITGDKCPRKGGLEQDIYGDPTP
jgi:hypothetical protein